MEARFGEPRCVVFLLVSAMLALGGCTAVARVTQVAVRRLALDPWQVLLWFGLAEAPVDELAARRLAPVRTGSRVAAVRTDAL